MRTSLVFAVLLTLSAGCTGQRSSWRCGYGDARTERQEPRRAVDADLTKKEFIVEVLQYLYRWHSDTGQWGSSTNEFDVWVKELNVRTDEGDRSRFAELWVPKLRLIVELKKADHDVPERKMVLKDKEFRVRSVHQLNKPSTPSSAWTIINLTSSEVDAQLARSRDERLFPDPAIEKRLQSALGDYLRRHHPNEMTTGSQTFHTAPMSLVSDELWIYWEDQRTAIRFAAEGDLGDPRIWDEMALHLRLIPLDASSGDAHARVLQSGHPVSREWVGRLLYNCIVLGRRFTMPFSPAAP